MPLRIHVGDENCEEVRDPRESGSQEEDPQGAICMHLLYPLRSFASSRSAFASTTMAPSSVGGKDDAVRASTRTRSLSLKARAEADGEDQVAIAAAVRKLSPGLDARC